MEFNIYGTEQLKELLNKLPSNLRDRVLIKALQKISKPIIDTAKQSIWNHQLTGRLYRSIGEKIDKKNLLITIGSRKDGKYKGYLAHLLENGTVERSYRTKKGNLHHTGKVKGIHFWENAVKQNESKIEELEKYIVESLEKEVERQYKKFSK